MASKLRFMILGAPGSGKGTISTRIIKEFKLTHLAAGDILRQHIIKKTPIGIKAKEAVDKGQLLPDEFITKIMVEEIRGLKSPNWLIDGFPRTLNQAKSLDAEKVELDAVVNLNVPFEEIANRLKHRWIHAPSGRVYNLEYNPPKVPFKDDQTGEPLTQREDDKPEIVLKRLKIYDEQMKPIVDFYNSKNLLATFTGNTSDYLWPLVRGHLEGVVQNYIKPTHTGQSFQPDDPRTLRFEGKKRQVNERAAIDLIKDDPIIVVEQRAIWSNSGGALGHPKVYINLDHGEVHNCGYSGRKFIQKKYYDEKKHGKSITYEQYLKEMGECPV